MKIKKILISIPIILTSIFLSSCALIRTPEEDTIVATNNSKELVSGHFYIWHDENQTNLENDIQADQSRFVNYDYKIFTPLLEKGVSTNSSNDIGDDLRIFWMTTDMEDKIPTIYEGDKLIFKSTAHIPSSIYLERFYDHGYSLGIYNIQELKTGRGLFGYSSQKDNELGLLSGTGAEKIYNTMRNEKDITLLTIGEKKLEESDISKSGTIKGLKKDATYDVEVYVGTTRHIVEMKANARIFSSMEKIPIVNTPLVGDGVMVYEFPEYMKSGYYYVANIGFFRYVAGKSYNESTDFNDPIIVKNASGTVVYDPTEQSMNKAEYDNYDANNDANTATMIAESIRTEEAGQQIYFRLTLKDNVNDVVDVPEIIYFVANAADEMNEDGTYKQGTYNHPWHLEILQSDLQASNGRIEAIVNSSTKRTVNYVFIVKNVGNYRQKDILLTLDADEFYGSIEDVEGSGSITFSIDENGLAEEIDISETTKPSNDTKIENIEPTIPEPTVPESITPKPIEDGKIIITKTVPANTLIQITYNSPDDRNITVRDNSKLNETYMALSGENTWYVISDGTLKISSRNIANEEQIISEDDITVTELNIEGLVAIYYLGKYAQNDTLINYSKDILVDVDTDETKQYLEYFEALKQDDYIVLANSIILKEDEMLYNALTEILNSVPDEIKVEIEKIL